MDISTKTTTVKKYTAISDDFIGPLLPNQVRLGDIDGKKIEYEKVDYGNVSKYEIALARLGDAAIIPEKNAKDYANEYIETYMDLNGDKVVDEKDIELLKSNFGTANKNILSKYDLNKDGKIDSTEVDVLKKYKNNEDISLDLNQYELVKFTYEKDLDDYSRRRESLSRYVDNLNSVIELAERLPGYEDDEVWLREYGMTKEQYYELRDKTNEEIRMLNETIKSQKKVVAQLPYLSEMNTKEFISFVENYKSNWQVDVNYEEVATYYSNGHNLKNYSKLDSKEVDYIAIVEYLVNVKGIKIEEHDELRDTYLNFIAMNDSQRYMYHYLFKTKGKEEADNYLKVIADDLNNNRGRIRAEKWIENIASKIQYDENGNITNATIDTTIESFLSTFGKGFDQGMKDYYSGMLKWNLDEYTEEEYEQMYIMQFLEQNGFLKGTYSVAEMIGNTEVAASVSTISSLLCPAGGYISLAINNGIGALSAGGNANHYALLNGNSSEKACEYASKIMQNQLVVNLSSAVVGYGVGSTLQFSSLFNGLNNLSVASSLALEIVNTGIGSITAVLSKGEEVKLKEAILNETIDADQASNEMLQAFLSSMAMSALSIGKTITFDVILGGEAISLSTDDWMDYLKSSEKDLLKIDINDFIESTKLNNDITTPKLNNIKDEYITLDLNLEENINVTPRLDINHDEFATPEINTSTNETPLLRQFTRVLANPAIDLEEKLVSRMPGNLTDLQKAKYLYNKINEELAYSPDYAIAVRDTNMEFARSVEADINNNVLGINNVGTREIVCDNWALLYAELLNKQGIDASVRGHGHKWVTFKLENGEYYFADATQPYVENMTDLANARLGTKSGGFIQIDETMAQSDVFANGMDNIGKIVSMNRKQSKNIQAIDNEIGYNPKRISDLFPSKKSNIYEILNINEDATNGEIAAAKFDKFIEPVAKNMPLVEGYKFIKRAKQYLFNKDELQYVRDFDVFYNWQTGKNYMLLQIDLQNGQVVEYMYHGNGTLIKNKI